MLYHQLLDKMPKGIQGMINLNSNNGRPGNNQDQNNQAAEDEDEQEEEVALVGFSLDFFFDKSVFL